MPGTRCFSTIVMTSLAIGLVPWPLPADDDSHDIAGYTRTHTSTATIDPNETDPQLLLEGSDSDRSALSVMKLYGKIYPVDEEGKLELPLSPGTYKLLLPGFDMRRDSWDVTINPGETTRIRFAALSQHDVRKAGERQEPYPFADDE